MKKALAFSVSAGTLSLLLFAGVPSFAEGTFPPPPPPAMEKKAPEMELKNVTKTVENITNGIVVTLTSDVPETVTLLQTQKTPFDGNTNFTVVKENLSNGVKVTVTATNAEDIAKLQAKAKTENNHQDEKDPKKAPEMEMKNVTKTVENITNGIVVTLTSDVPETVTLLQNQKTPFDGNTNLTVVKENLSNGVKVTVTATNADEIAKLQEKAAQKEIRENYKEEKQGIREKGKEEIKTLRTQQQESKKAFRDSLLEMKKTDQQKSKALKSENNAQTADAMIQIAGKALEYKKAILAATEKVKADLLAAGQASTPGLDEQITYLTSAISTGEGYIADAKAADTDTAKKAAAKKAIEALLGNPLRNAKKFEKAAQ
ncbi:MAG: hypothetical protein WCJ84_02860 [Candidatus Peregrinibacteria bacterium]